MIYFFERRYTQKSPQHITDVFSGVWWSVQTMTSVGYGDKKLYHPFSKGFAVIFMLVGTCLFAALVSTINTSLAAYNFNQVIVGPRDLAGKQVAALDLLKNQNIEFGNRLTYYPTLEEAAASVLKGQNDCVIADNLVLHYFLRNQDHSGNFMVVGPLFHQMNFAMALPAESPNLSKINKAILTLYQNGDFDRIYYRWFN